MKYILILLVFLFANEAFYLIPGYHIRGVFRLSDLGIVAIVAGLIWSLTQASHPARAFKGVGLLIVAYLFMIAAHVSIAAFNYNQSIFDGLVAARHQFYWASYFLFFYLLENEKVAEKTMNLLMWTAIVVVILSVVNYMGLTVFHHRWAVGHGTRFGITRAFIPGMSLIGVAFVWAVARYIQRGRAWSKPGGYAIFLFAAIVFRQTRMRIVAATATLAWALFRERRFKLLVMGIGIGAIGVAAMGLLLEQNILVAAFSSAFSDVTEQEGTWTGRMQTMEIAISAFMEHPVFGTGALVLRLAEDELSREAVLEAYKGDLGYVHLLKNFGVVGVIWVIALLLSVFFLIKKIRKNNTDDVYVKFTEYEFIQIAISMFTLNYFGKIDGIVVICLTLALLSRRALSANSIAIQEKKVGVRSDWEVDHEAHTMGIVKRRRKGSAR